MRSSLLPGRDRIPPRRGLRWRGGGRKPWRQKGLGRARHGSIRSPQWVGGGVAHGPKPRDYTQRVNRKMRRLALNSSLSVRAADRKVKVAEDFDWSEPKTKNAQGFLTKSRTVDKVLVVLSPTDRTAKLSFRNLPRVRINGVDQLATYDVLWADEVVFTASALGQLQGDRLVRRHGQRLRPRRERRSRDERG